MEGLGDAANPRADFRDLPPLTAVNGRPRVAVIGGGPAGLRAAEIASAGGAAVTLFDAKPSVGRKFLVAGRGGLNLTHVEPPAEFAMRYRGPGSTADWWRVALADFDSDALRRWAADLGVETFAASTGRVYPRELKAAPLLRRWIQRLRAGGVEFVMNHRWVDVAPGAPLRLDFHSPQRLRSMEADAVILALGGGSWPETGSDGAWTTILERLGVAVSRLAPANCGWEVDWPAVILGFGGVPLKNLTASAGNATARGELLITRYGLEGGALYKLGPVLRQMEKPALVIDFKPDLRHAQLVAKLGPNPRNPFPEARQRWRLSEAAWAIVQYHLPAESVASAEALAAAVKACAVPMTQPRPLAEAISSAGGVAWSELDAGLMLRRIPGVFVAGEMIDWEAPTGGYLIQGCFVTGTRAARASLAWLSARTA